MRLFEGTEFDVPPRCDRCKKLEEECQCEPIPEPKLPPSDQTASVRSEKRKRGKMVTVVSGLNANDCDLESLVSTLKNHCGAGGTVKDDVIEIQGEQTERVRSKLRELGYKLR